APLRGFLSSAPKGRNRHGIAPEHGIALGNSVCYTTAVAFSLAVRPPLAGFPAMLLRLAKRLLLETDKRLLWKLAWNMGFKGMLSVEKHKLRLRRGEVFPPFLYISI